MWRYMTASSARAAAPLGWLPTGEPFYAPIGEMRYDGDRVQCHLCDRWLRLVGGSHLTRAHGWTLSAYRNAFKLLATRTTAAPVTSALMRANMLRRIDGTSRADMLRARQRSFGIEFAVEGLREVVQWRSLPNCVPRWSANGTLSVTRVSIRAVSGPDQLERSGGAAGPAGIIGRPRPTREPKDMAARGVGAHERARRRAPAI